MVIDKPFTTMNPNTLEQCINVDEEMKKDEPTSIYNEELAEENNRNLLRLTEGLSDAYAEAPRTRIIHLSLKYWVTEFHTQSLLQSLFKVFVMVVYLSILCLGFLACYSSFNLLVNCGFNGSFSSDKPLRVDYANKITNTGAFLAAITDLPAISFVVYLLVIKNAHTNALRTVLNHIFFNFLAKNPDLNGQQHEALYQRHVKVLQETGIETYYMSPNKQSYTGTIHEELAPILQDIDSNIKVGVVDVCQTWVSSFQKASLLLKCGKLLGLLATLTIFFSMMLFSVFVIFQNLVLVFDTPVPDLFIGSTDKQVDEAFYLTQVGGLFSCLIGLIVASYGCWFLSLKPTYYDTKHTKIKIAFASINHTTTTSLTIQQHKELFNIRECKLSAKMRSLMH